MQMQKLQMYKTFKYRSDEFSWPPKWFPSYNSISSQILSVFSLSISLSLFPRPNELERFFYLLFLCVHRQSFVSLATTRLIYPLCFVPFASLECLSFYTVCDVPSFFSHLFYNFTFSTLSVYQCVIAHILYIIFDIVANMHRHGAMI